MILKPEELIRGFTTQVMIHHPRNIEHGPISIVHELVKCPHKIKALDGRYAVYIFTLTPDAKCSAGRNRSLKVGRVSPGANQRFKYQHYLPNSAGSNLSRSIISHPILWEAIGFSVQDPIQDVKKWVQENTERDHFFVQSRSIAELLEIYIRGMIGSIYEGAASPSRSNQ